MSIPFCGKELTLLQPDGSTLRVRGWGDQFQAVFETLEGFTVVRDPVTSFYQYATVSEDREELLPTGFQAGIVNPNSLGISHRLRTNGAGLITPKSMSSGLLRMKTRWETRREIGKMRLRAEMMAPESILPAPPQRQTVGEFIGLCLLIDFPDAPGTISRNEVEAYCNQHGYTGFGNNGSVLDYFMDNSGGKLHYTCIVAPYYTAKYNREYYTDESQPYGLRAQELIREALNYLKSSGYNFSPLTADEGKYVYATNVFYAGDCTSNWGQGLWPHSSRLDNDCHLMTGKIAADYQITNIGRELTLGTFCHENGHMICEFPDLYDYKRDGVYSHGVGSFCLMCSGSLPEEKNPAQICAYLKYRAGWADTVTEMASNMDATIRAGANDFFILQKNLSEYFIIENRTKSGRDQSLPGSGLAIWHIDELGSNENQSMTSSSHYECSLAQADGESDLERGEAGNSYGEAKDLFYAGGNDHFGQATNPNSRWWNGQPSGLEVTNIGTSGRVMTFKVNA
jgi:M6 family metalloprotease-like protein